MGQSPLPLLRQLMLLCLLVLPVHGYSTVEPTSSDVASDLKHFKELSKQRLDSIQALLQRDIQAQGQRLDSQDKRIEGLGKQLDTQNTHIDQNLSILGSVLSWLGIILPLAALAGYLSIRRKARQEAKTEARRWFEKYAADLKSELQRLKEEAKQVEDEVDFLRRNLAQYDGEAKAHAAKVMNGLTEHSDAQKEEIRLAKEAALATMSADTTRRTEQPLTRKQQKALTDAGQAAMEKPESQYELDDWDNRAFAALASNDKEEAARCWAKAAGLMDISAPDQARMLLNRGIVLGELNRRQESVTALNEIIQRFSANDSPSIRNLVAKAMFSIGAMHHHSSEAEEALIIYSNLIHQFKNNETPEIRKIMAKTMLNRGVILGKLNDPESEQAEYSEIIKKFKNDKTPEIIEQVAMAMFNKAVALGQQNEPNAELDAYNDLIRAFSNYELPEIRLHVAKAMLCRAMTLAQQNQTATAIAEYDNLIQHFSSDGASTIRAQIAGAQNGKGFTLLCQAKKNWADAAARDSTLQQAAQLFNEALSGSADQDKSVILGNQSYCAHLLGEPSEIVLPTLEQALELGGESLYKVTLGDLAIYPVPEKDEPFRALLEEVWSEVQAEKSQ